MVIARLIHASISRTSRVDCIRNDYGLYAESPYSAIQFRIRRFVFCFLLFVRGDTVLYVNHEDALRALEYDLGQEEQFVYAGLTHEQMVEHITKFISGIWQIHPFGEGNTRTTAVFAIKYLRSIGFYVENDLFANNSWYFRNALVRTNYRNAVKGIEPDMKYLIRFFRNLLLGETNELKNRYMVIDAPEECK